MATHVSLLARIIPQTEKPGRLKFMGLQRVRHNVLTDQQSEQLKNCILKFDTWSIMEFFALMLIFFTCIDARSWGEGGIQSDVYVYGVSFWDDETILEETGVMAVQPREYTKSLRTILFQRVNCMVQKTPLIKIIAPGLPWQLGLCFHCRGSGFNPWSKN